MIPTTLRRLWRPPSSVLAKAPGAAPRSLLGEGLAPRTHPDWTSNGAVLQQVRHGPKDGRPGRLQHHIFGCDKAKGRYYYRFHKLIGKWNWRKYKERYIAPRALENRQRWIPTPHATYSMMRHSYSWYWRLPKAIAAATTPDEVLEAWIKFRHKHPKKTFHYFKVLKRLIDVGGSDPTDWRLKFITSRLHNIHRKILNLPRLAKYYAQLRVIDELEHMSNFLPKMLHKYSPQQLVLTAHSFGSARLQDKFIFAEVAKHVEPQLAAVSPSDLVRLAQAYAAVEVCHYTLLTRLSSQLQVRAQQSAEGQAPPWSCPTFSQLTEVAEAFARLKFQDYSYAELCAEQAAILLREGLPGPTPVALARLCSACAQLKIHEVRLYEVVLAHISGHWYDYPASALAEIGAAVAPVLPRDSEQIQQVYKLMLRTIAADRDMLTLQGVSFAARFMAELDHKGEFYPGFSEGLARRVMELRDETKEQYDIARVIEIFARRCPEERALFSTLCRHMHRHLAVFEPVDFVRTVRGLSLTEYRDDRVVYSLAKWAGKRAAEFSSYDWDSFITAVAVLKGKEGGALEERLRLMAPPMLIGGYVAASPTGLLPPQTPASTSAAAV
mmetsp:Transcript_18140/g.50422  ORF Transcript_18140/g.50422 Transcript_18140/m.50422 type:complete len:609 (+) Transcript_18140:147-1973(+)